MTQENWAAFCKLMEAVDDAVGARPRSEAALLIMFKALSRFPLKDVSRAMTQHIERSQYAVKVADVVAILEGAPEEKSALAWRGFIRAIELHGGFVSVKFPDPAYHYAIGQLGGWEHIANHYGAMSYKELEFREKDFRQLYEIGERIASFEHEEGKIRVPLYLWGESERTNREVGGEDCLAFCPVMDALSRNEIPREALGALAAPPAKRLPKTDIKRLEMSDGAERIDAVRGHEPEAAAKAEIHVEAEGVLPDVQIPKAEGKRGRVRRPSSHTAPGSSGEVRRIGEIRPAVGEA